MLSETKWLLIDNHTGLCLANLISVLHTGNGKMIHYVTEHEAVLKQLKCWLEIISFPEDVNEAHASCGLSVLAKLLLITN